MRTEISRKEKVGWQLQQLIYVENQWKILVLSLEVQGEQVKDVHATDNIGEEEYNDVSKKNEDYDASLTGH